MARKRFCEECGRPALVFRRIIKGRKKGALKIFTDKYHTLCYCCAARERERNREVPQKENQ